MDELRFKMVLVNKRESQSDNARTPAIYQYFQQHFLLAL